MNDFEKYYGKLAIENASNTVAGRYELDAGKEELILNDFFQKLNISGKESFLDIGCGGSELTYLLLSRLLNNDVDVSVIDIPEVIEVVKKRIVPRLSGKVILYAGIFPESVPSILTQFDRILMYSVLHCSNDPEKLLEDAVTRLKPYGKLLVGDLPNISRKGRFLSSPAGRKFEAGYRNMQESQLPTYRNHHDFVAKMKNDVNYYSLIDDDFILQSMKKYSDRGYDTYLLPQSELLPFGRTRQDLLISRYE